MAKYITRDELPMLDGAIDFQGLLYDILSWQDSVDGGDCYDIITYEVLDSVIDLIIDNTIFE